MLTQQDLLLIEQLLDRKLEEKLEQKLEDKLNQKLDQKLDEKLNPIKKGLDQKLDEKLKPIKRELKKIRNDQRTFFRFYDKEMVSMKGRVDNLEYRLNCHTHPD